MIFREENGAANIATVVERKSRYNVLFRNNEEQSPTIAAFVPTISDGRSPVTIPVRSVPQAAYRSISI